MSDSQENHSNPRKLFYKTILGIFLFFTIFLIAAPLLVNYSSIKSIIEHKISTTHNVRLLINGKMRFQILPSPAIIAQDVLMQNYVVKSADKKNEEVFNFLSDEIKIKFSFFGDNTNPKSVIFKNAIFETYSFDKIPENRDNQIVKKAEENAQKIIEKIQQTNQEIEKIKPGFAGTILNYFSIDLKQINLAKVKNFNLKNSEIIYYDYLGRKQAIHQINADLDHGEKTIYGSGDFVTSNIINNFDISLNFGSNSSDNDSVFNLHSSALDLKMSGKFSSQKGHIIDSVFRGNIEAKILELKSFYKSYFSSKSVLFQKLKPNPEKPINLSANINIDAQVINFEDLKIDSVLMKGAGVVDIDFARNFPIIDLQLDFDNFDLESIWSNAGVSLQTEIKPKKDKKETEEKIVKQEIVNPVLNEKAIEKKQEIEEEKQAKKEEKNSADIVEINEKTAENSKEEITEKPAKNDPEPKKEPEVKTILANKINLDFIAKNKNFDLAAEISIKELQSTRLIKDVQLYFSASNNGEILILPLVFRIPGDGIFRVTGILDASRISPKFVGKIDASGRQFGDVLRWLNLGAGKIKYQNFSNYNLYSDVLLTANNSNFNNLYLSLNNSENEFLGNFKISERKKYSDIKGDFKISEIDLDKLFNLQKRSKYLSRGLLLKKLFWLNDLASENDLFFDFGKITYLGHDFYNQALELQFGRGFFKIPKFNFNANDSDISGKIAIDIRSKNPQFYLSLSSNNLIHESDNKKEDLVEDIYSLPSLEGFKGGIDLTFNNIKINDFAAENFKLLGKINDGIIKKSKITADIYNGNLTYDGLLGLKINKSINGNIKLTKASLKPLMSDIAGINNIAGVANIATSITSSASKKSEFGKTLSLNSKFSITSPTIYQYGLKDLTKKMFNIRRHARDLRTPEKVLLNQDAKTKFTQGSGAIKINNGAGKMRIDLKSKYYNGTLSGNINSATKEANLIFNTIFLTGSRKKQTPLNIIARIEGPLDNLQQSTNLDQARQYLGLPRKHMPLKKKEKKVEEEKPSKEKSVKKDLKKSPQTLDDLPEIKNMDDFRRLKKLQDSLKNSKKTP